MHQVTKYYVVDLQRDLVGPFTTRTEVETKLNELRKKLPGDTLSIETRVTLEEDRVPVTSPNGYGITSDQFVNGKWKNLNPNTYPSPGDDGSWG